VFSGGSASSFHSHPGPGLEPLRIDDRDATIAQLTLEKQNIEKDYESLKNRFKKLLSFLSEAEGKSNSYILCLMFYFN